MKLSLSVAALMLAATVHAHTGPHYGILGMGGDLQSPTRPSAIDDLLGCSTSVVASTSLTEINAKDPIDVSFAFDDAYSPSTRDWIGYYCSDDLSSLDDHSYLDYRYLSESEVSSKAGDFSVALLSGRMDTCEFRFFAGSPSYCKIGSTPPIKILNSKTIVTQLHLALTSDNTEMRVSWTAGVNSSPRVTFGKSSGDLASTAEGTCKTYTNTDMCEAPATDSSGFVEPGWLCTAVLTGLLPDAQYFYAATSDGEIFSAVHSFQAAPPQDNPDYQHSWIMYGDMGTYSGTTPVGAASIATANISLAEVEKKVNGARRIDHFGDISYARGTSSTWDVWFDLIEPYAAQVPYMITIGNHEFDYVSTPENDPSINAKNPEGTFRPSWWNGGSDSGGECSVPMHNRFTMPESEFSNDIYWYDYDYANVHTVMMSSEHNCTAGSPQYKFLADSLAKVDRTKTPWIIVEFHRPMYNNEQFESDYNVAVGMQREFEDLLVSYDVDLVVAGHYHSYVRTSRIYKDHKNEEKGIYHMTVGSAGASLDDAGLYPKDWVEYFSLQFGVSRVTVMNSTHMHWEFIENKDNDNTGAVMDETWIVKRGAE
jgi:hypothetical protein